MKTLISAFLVFTGISVMLTACNQDPQSANGPQTVLPLSSGSTPAHPAVTYGFMADNAIAVMDSDGSHQTNVLSVKSPEEVYHSCWSPTGSSIAYLEMTTGTYINSLRAMDISVNSKGVAVASNVRTIYGLQTSDSTLLSTPCWCSNSSTGKIAFVRQHLGSKLGLAELCTISQSGGTVTILDSYQKLNSNGIVISHYTYPTWSPDDSKIAVIREDTILHSTIMIFDASTGSALDSIPLSGGVMSLEWSHSGSNELVFVVSPNSSTPYEIYYCVPSTGSTPTTNSVVAGCPTWSPNNSGVMYTGTSGSLMKLQSFTSNTTTLQSSGFGGLWLNWKQ